MRTLMEERKSQKKNGRKRDGLKAFDFIHINAFSLTNPNLVYTILCEKILG